MKECIIYSGEYLCMVTDPNAKIRNNSTRLHASKMQKENRSSYCSKNRWCKQADKVLSQIKKSKNNSNVYFIIFAKEIV